MNTTVGASKKDKGYGIQGDPLGGRVAHAFFVARRPGGWGAWCYHAPRTDIAGGTALKAANALTASHGTAPAASSHFVITLSLTGTESWRASCPCGWTSTSQTARGGAEQSGAVHWDKKHSTWAPEPSARNKDGTVKVRVAKEGHERLPSRFTATVKKLNGRITLVKDDRHIRAKVGLPTQAAERLVGGPVRFKVTQRPAGGPDVVMPLLYEGSQVLKTVRAALVRAGGDPSELDELVTPMPPPRKDKDLLLPRTRPRRRQGA